VALVAGACGAAAPAATSSPAGSAAAASPTLPPIVKVTVGLPGPNGVLWPYYVADTKGFFKDARLEFEPVLTDSNVKGVQGLISGSLNFFGASPDPLIRAVAESNAELVIVGSAQDRPIYTLIVQPEIKSYADLKGKRVGVSALLSMDSVWLQQMLKANGLKDGEFEVVEIGGTANRYAALKAKGISAALVTQPSDFTALKDGFARLGDSTEVVKEISWTCYATSKAFAAANPDVVVRYLGAIRKAHIWLADPANKTEAVAILVKATNSTPEVATQTYELWSSRKSLTAEGEGSPTAIKTMIDTLVSIRQLKAPIAVERVFDPSFMQKAKAKG
jgi:ABC-type nitrate/sulfonate/bicarbonate transport system substrate-binding protein